jgi:hypothetical protein
VPRALLVIDSVDAVGRAISFRIDSGSQTLEVLDRTQISLDGQGTDLASLKPGHWAYFAYNPERGALRWVQAYSDDPRGPQALG